MVLSMTRWCGKVAVVTGASSGIGAAIAAQLTENGLKVVGLARRVERVEELSKKLTGAKGKLYSFKCDISKEEDILQAFDWIRKNIGPVSILINNAGINKANNVHDGETNIWKEVIDVNVLGLCIATREALKDMRAHNIDGHIVHINSIAGHHVPNIPNIGLYAATKYAGRALKDALRNELVSLESKIKVTTICPGYVKTEFLQVMYEGRVLNYDHLPFLNPEDIADGVVYVLSTPPHVQIDDLVIKPVGEPY